MIMEEFALQYIKENNDGNVLAKVYLDFVSAVDYLQSLDKEQLQAGGDQEKSKAYLRDFNLNFLSNCLYMYPEDQTDEVTSQATSYNMFGDFYQSTHKDGNDTLSHSLLHSVCSNKLKAQALLASVGSNMNPPVAPAFPESKMHSRKYSLNSDVQ